MSKSNATQAPVEGSAKGKTDAGEADFDAAVELIAECDMSSEAPGIHADPDMDGLIFLARRIRARARVEGSANT